MKWMKWLLVLIAGAGLALGSIGCDDDSDSDSNDGGGLAGTWRLVSMDAIPIPNSIWMQIILRENGTAETTSNIAGLEPEVGQWTEAGGVLTLTSDDGAEAMPYTLRGDDLELQTEDGDMIFARQ